MCMCVLAYRILLPRFQQSCGLQGPNMLARLVAHFTGYEFGHG